MVPENDVARAIVHASVKVHRALGPGLLESVYEAVLAYELRRSGLEVRRQLPIPIEYDGMILDETFRADLVVNDLVLVELKSVAALLSLHRKQTLTYLRLGGFRLGILLNFNAPRMKDGICRIANGLPD